MATTHSTLSVPPAQRLEYWHDAVCDVFIHLDIDTPAVTAEGFDGRIVQHLSGHLDYAEVIADGHVALRSKHHVSKANDDCFLVLVQRSGQSWLEQDGRSSWLRPGEFALCDSSRPYQMRLPEFFHHDVLKIQARALRETLRVPERFTARAIASDGAAGRIFLRAVNVLSETADELSDREAAGISDSLLDLLGAAIGSLPEAKMPVPRNIERYHRERVRELVRENLFDSELSVERIAAGVNLSLRYVHSLFESEPMTLAAWIWHERLEAGRRYLLSPTMKQQSVTEIAYSVGFKDPAHFSRMFKAAYGASPREFRNSLS